MLNPDFREMLSCLKDEEVEFIIVGAYALTAHGLPRATGDIDIWVKNSPDNAQRMMIALVKFGAPISNLSEEDFISPDMIVQIGVEPCRIDLLTSIDGVESLRVHSSQLAAKASRLRRPVYFAACCGAVVF